MSTKESELSETFTEAPAAPAVTRWRAKGAPEVEAVHWDGAVNTATTIISWMLETGGTARYHDGPSALSIDTVDGTRMAVPGDWIARYPAGTYRPFTEDEFAASYEPAGESDVPVPAGELAAFGLVLERAEKALADALGIADAMREQVASEIEAEAAGHLHSIRRGMRWAAWVARGKPAASDPGNDHQLSGALLHGDAARTATPCCPVEAAAVQRATVAERERIRALFDTWITIAMSEPSSHPPEAWKIAFADLISDEPQFAIGREEKPGGGS